MQVDLIRCPHCGITGDRRGRLLREHITRCPRDPALYTAIKAALTGRDGYGLSRRAYEAGDYRGRVPSAGALRRTLGSWSAVLAYFDVPAADPATALLNAVIRRSLKIGRRRATLDEIAAAEMAIDAAIIRAALASKWDRGVAVCGVRRLPDGRYAWMLR